MNYPLQLSFKIMALASQIYVRDSGGGEICYVKQKMFKLKEAVQVFTDSTRSNELCEIKADKIIDFSATYSFIDTQGKTFGAVRRKGMRSLWKAHYQITQSSDVEFEINEENGWIKVLDGLLGEIPLIGFLSGYFLHPTYVATRSIDGTPVMRVTKVPAFWEGRFKIEKLADIDEREELNLLMGFMMMLLLERRRG
ncbi:MAG: hypothetical protein KDN22_07890 [Verrucomicrobiae bacterium]|nr:hypothetical protein [Verrucomicrobiae bacterium]